MFDPMGEVDRVLAAQVGWTWLDDHLLYACGVRAALRDGGTQALRPVATAIRTSPSEVCVGEAPGAWAVFRRPSPQPVAPAPVAPPVMPIAINTASAAVYASRGRYSARRAQTMQATAAYHQQRRAELTAVRLTWAAAQAAHYASAAAAAEQRRSMDARWIPEPAGSVTVTTDRFHLSNSHRSSPIPLADVERVELTRPDRLRCDFTDAAGTLHHLEIASPLAATMFLVAAHAHFPHHPQLLSGVWLPAGFEDRCAVVGKPCPRVR
ncbi:hypothetical protein [Nocardia camponoti]|uniref:Uncharacterized protein n=1 Tax=Nocardia camponoti TaxID=1616106 RepID=A0A917QI56_9NOCA|nr:hypothetical protein [Nocardia camponoti]GGK50178.1 hypothetical protein GCM10011591_22160 [Nocardia camponoti]